MAKGQESTYIRSLYVNLSGGKKKRERLKLKNEKKNGKEIPQFDHVYGHSLGILSIKLEITANYQV